MNAHEAYVHGILARNTLLLYAAAIPLIFGFTGATIHGKAKRIYTIALVAVFYVSLGAFYFLYLPGD